ncbi:ABC transporter permease [Alphaproteobacteria bacterium]|nr:ABC transporter permease [Alphaproteobacteria bacterium]
MLKVATEISQAFGRYRVVYLLGWQDVRNRYRRSILGPFWLTISIGVMISSIGYVFGQIFRIPLDEYIPFLTTGFIFWIFFTGTIAEGCHGFTDAETVIKQLPLPLLVHVLRVLWRNLLIMFHNILILPIVLVAFPNDFGFTVLLAIPGLILTVVCLGGMALTLSILCARYRDLPQIVGSLLQVAFYLTPIVWMPSLLPARANASLLQLNPFYHLLELIRSPILGNVPSVTSWLAVIAMAVIIWVLALLLFYRFRKRIAYWI